MTRDTTTTHHVHWHRDIQPLHIVFTSENEGEFSVGLPRERYTEGDWYPREAYWPFWPLSCTGGPSVTTVHSGAAPEVASRRGRRVFFLSRANARSRHLSNEPAVLRALNTTRAPEPTDPRAAPSRACPCHALPPVTSPCHEPLSRAPVTCPCHVTMSRDHVT